MKILAIDTSTEVCSVAIIQDEILLSEIILANNETHSKNLIKIISQALKLLSLDIKEID